MKGDVLKTIWGYDQTNADFYQVIRVVSAKSVELREIKATIKTDSGHGAMTGVAEPVVGEFVGEAFIARVKPAGAKIDNCRGHATKWNGKPINISWYA